MRSAMKQRWIPLLATLAVLGGSSLSTTACFGRRAFVSVGTAIDILPSGFVTVRVGSGRYFYHRGVFYQPYRGGYLVVVAPLGAMVPRLPSGRVMVLVENDPFVYYRGVFYQPVPSGYIVTRAPLGAFVRGLPPGALTRWVDGVEYKEYAGAWYRPAIRDGDEGWQVTDPPERR
jgi:hypothetical protein